MLAMRVVVRTPDGKQLAYDHATATVDPLGTLIIRGHDGRRLATYQSGDAESFDVRPDENTRGGATS